MGHVLVSHLDLSSIFSFFFRDSVILKPMDWQKFLYLATCAALLFTPHSYLSLPSSPRRIYDVSMVLPPPSSIIFMALMRESVYVAES